MQENQARRKNRKVLEQILTRFVAKGL